MDNGKLKEIARNLVKKYAQLETSQGFKPDGLHPYTDENGELIYFRIRLKNHTTGAKWIKPFYFDKHKNTYVMREPKHEFIDGKPLYRLDDIRKNSDACIYVVEGEKCVEALNKIGFIATTSGSYSSAKNTNWKPLAGKEIILWPDLDEKGFQYAEEVKEILTALNCKITIINVKDLKLKEKDDCIDWMKANPSATHTDILSLPLTEPSNEEQAHITDYDKSINDLAKLSEIDYQHQRKGAAENLKISVTILDKLVKQERKNAKEQTNNIFPEIGPWHENVSANALLDDLEDILNQVLVFPSQHEARAIALWIIHTHCLDAASVSPILNINSPEKRCGKSTLLAVLQLLVNKPLIASNITAAAMFRSIEKWQPTLLIDEADTFMRDNEELRGVINSGHTRKLAYTLRCVGDKHEPVPFCTWGAKVIAGIGHLAETIEDRSILIQLRRKLPNEKRIQLRSIAVSIFYELIRKCVRFKNDFNSILIVAKPKMPEILNDRATDNWTPLFAIAELAGSNWFKSAEEAALYLSGSKQDSPSIGAELLQDIKNIFDTKGVDRLYTHELLTALHTEEEAPWATYNRGKPLSARQLANKLKDYKIQSKDMRLPPFNKNLKGYGLEDFSEAFSRYISQNPSVAATSATALQDVTDATSSVAPISNVANGLSDRLNILSDVALTYPRQIQNVADEKTSQSLTHADCSVVADKTIND